MQAVRARQTVIEPSLTTVARGSVEGLSNFMRPAMKFALLMSVGVAMILLTSTTAPAEGDAARIDQHDPPLAVSLPPITEDRRTH
jgi:hypothetical protein